jgi:hypothetical protein
VQPVADVAFCLSVRQVYNTARVWPSSYLAPATQMMQLAGMLAAQPFIAEMYSLITNDEGAIIWRIKYIGRLIGCHQLNMTSAIVQITDSKPAKLYNPHRQS